MDNVSIFSVQYASGTVNESSCDVETFTCMR